MRDADNGCSGRSEWCSRFRLRSATGLLASVDCGEGAESLVMDAMMGEESSAPLEDVYWRARIQPPRRLTRGEGRTSRSQQPGLGVEIHLAR